MLVEKSSYLPFVHFLDMNHYNWTWDPYTDFMEKRGEIF